jgi:hypothetical protein
MVAHDLLVLVDDAPAVPSEQAAGTHCVQIPPRIDAVAARHHTIMPARDLGERALLAGEGVVVTDLVVAEVQRR